MILNHTRTTHRANDHNMAMVRQAGKTWEYYLVTFVIISIFWIEHSQIHLSTLSLALPLVTTSSPSFYPFSCCSGHISSAAVVIMTRFLNYQHRHMPTHSHIGDKNWTKPQRQICSCKCQETHSCQGGEVPAENIHSQYTGAYTESKLSTSCCDRKKSVQYLGTS